MRRSDKPPRLNGFCIEFEDSQKGTDRSCFGTYRSLHSGIETGGDCSGPFAGKPAPTGIVGDSGFEHDTDTVGDSMVEGKPSTRFRLVFTLPFQQCKYDPRQLTGQDHQGLRCTEAPSSLLLVKPFPGGGAAG